MSDNVLSAKIAEGPEFSVTFAVEHRDDPLEPYAHTLPKGLCLAGGAKGLLVLPLGGHLHQYGVQLRFVSVKDVDALMAELADLRVLLADEQSSPSQGGDR